VILDGEADVLSDGEMSKEAATVENHRDFQARADQLFFLHLFDRFPEKGEFAAQRTDEAGCRGEKIAFAGTCEAPTAQKSPASIFQFTSWATGVAEGLPERGMSA
jgi:hypothetical protein